MVLEAGQMESDGLEDLFSKQTLLEDVDDSGLEFLKYPENENHTDLLRFLQKTDREKDKKTGEPQPCSLLLEESVADDWNKNLPSTFQYTSDTLNKLGSPSNDLNFSLILAKKNVVASSPLMDDSNLNRRQSQIDFNLDNELNRTFTLLDSNCSADGDLNQTFTLDNDELSCSDMTTVNSASPTNQISRKLSGEKRGSPRLSRMRAASLYNLQQQSESSLQNTCRASTSNLQQRNESSLQNFCRASTSNLLSNTFGRKPNLSMFGKGKITTSDGTLNTSHQARSAQPTAGLPAESSNDVAGQRLTSREGTSLPTKEINYVKAVCEKNIDITNNVDYTIVNNNNCPLVNLQQNKGASVRRFGSRLPMPVSRSSTVGQRTSLPISKLTHRNAK